jgi:hypothetical protein
MAAQGRAGVRRSRLDSIAQTRLGDVRRAARGRRGLVLALLALGLRGCAADGWRPREFTPIHEVVGAPALLLYGGQVRSCFSSRPQAAGGGAGVASGAGPDMQRGAWGTRRVVMAAQASNHPGNRPPQQPWRGRVWHVALHSTQTTQSVEERKWRLPEEAMRGA